MSITEPGYAPAMMDQPTDQRIQQPGSGQVDGPEWGAADNATGNAAPEVAGDVLGEHARDGVSDADRDLRPTLHHRDPGDLHQPRTGAETPVDAEDLVHARGQDVTPATLRAAQEALDAEGPEAVEREVPPLDE